jgi:hypothetical protein
MQRADLNPLNGSACAKVFEVTLVRGILLATGILAHKISRTRQCASGVFAGTLSQQRLANNVRFGAIQCSRSLFEPI